MTVLRGPNDLRVAVASLALPVAALSVLVGKPNLDAVWQSHPAHFWCVLSASVVSVALAYVTGYVARRRRDARVFLVSLAFLASAGFFGLHALATPGVLQPKSNQGFTLAMPVGLLVAAAFAAASSVDLSPARAEAVMRRASLLQWALLAAMTGWATGSLSGVGPLNDPSAPERASGRLLAVAAMGVLLYGIAVTRYLRLYRRRPSGMLLALSAAFALLAEVMVAIAIGRNWHASWWAWHLMMLMAFALVAWSADRQWHEERFSSLYLRQTASARREVTVLFADLEGFTGFSESHDPEEVAAMLNEYLAVAIPPIVKRNGGEIDRLMGDGLMVVFNRRGNQPDHALRAARAALAIQRATAAIAREHPTWPRFRVGLNTGDAMVGLLGADGARTHTVIGDTVNLASRLEGAAPPGGVAVGAETLRQLPHAHAEPLGSTVIKGRAEPVDAHLLLDLV